MNNEQLISRYVSGLKMVSWVYALIQMMFVFSQLLIPTASTDLGKFGFPTLFLVSSLLNGAIALNTKAKNYRPQNKFFILHEGPLGVFNDTLKEVSYDEIEEENEIVEVTKNGWIGYTDHYWQVAIFPDVKEKFKARFKNIKASDNSIQVAVSYTHLTLPTIYSV